MSDENEDIKSTTPKQESVFMRKVKGYAIGFASLLSSFSGLANTTTNNISTSESEPIVKETTYVAPENNDTEKTLAMDEATIDLALRRTSENKSAARHFTIGSISKENIIDPDKTPYSINVDAQANFNKGLVRETYEIETAEEFNNIVREREGNIASCYNNIYNLPKYKLSGEMKDLVDSILEIPEIKDMYSDNDIINFEYLRQNPIAELLIKTHEVDIHGHHEAQGTAMNIQHSPYMAVVSSHITEKMAEFGEFMALARIYGSLKSKGIETLNNEPLDKILDYKEGLRDLLNKYNSDIENPNFIIDAAMLSSQQWDKDRGTEYIKQERKHAETAENCSLIGMIIQARNWDETTHAMLKGIRIMNQDLNIPDECLQYFLPSNERISNILGDDYITNENLLDIDKYLDSIGLKNDSAKARYLNKQASKINSRDNEADLHLRDLFLACGKDNSGIIWYSDDIVDEVHADGSVTVWDEKNNFYASMQKLDDAFRDRMVAKRLEEVKAKIINKTEQQTSTQETTNDVSTTQVKTENTETNQINLDVTNLIQQNR